MPTVRTTMRPDLELDVDPIEYLDLKRQGLLVEPAAEPPPSVPDPGPAITKKAAPSAATKEG